MQAQRWPDFVQPTTKNRFYKKKKKKKKKLRWPNVGLMLFNRPNANNFGSAILYVGPMLAQRCKANTIKDVPFQIHLAHFDVGPMLALRCVPNANYQPTVQRFTNVGPTQSCYLGKRVFEEFSLMLAGWIYTGGFQLNLTALNLISHRYSKIRFYVEI